MSHTLKCSPSLLGRCLTSRGGVLGGQLIGQQSVSQPFGQPIIVSSSQMNLQMNSRINSKMNQQQIRCITRGRVNVLREMKWRSKSFDVVPHKLRHRREWLDWNYDCEIYSFNQRLKEKFTEHTLKKAFIFESYYQTSPLFPGAVEETEATEEATEETAEDASEKKTEETTEISDSVFQLDTNREFIQSGTELCERFICQYLRYFLRQLPEEGIIATKQFLMSEKSLSEMAEKIGTKDLILCKEFPVPKNILAQTMLSLIGALKHDTDEKHTTRFIIDFVMTYLNSIDIMDIWDIWEVRKPSLLVAQICKSNGIRGYEYRLMRQTGANTILPTYMVGIYANKKLLGFGPGCSIREAKNMAAYDCLRRLFNLNIVNQFYRFGEQAYDLDYKSFDRPNQSLDDFKVPQLERFARPTPIASS